MTNAICYAFEVTVVQLLNKKWRASTADIEPELSVEEATSKEALETLAKELQEHLRSIGKNSNINVSVGSNFADHTPFLAALTSAQHAYALLLATERLESAHN